MGSPRAYGGRVSSENRKGAGPTGPLAGSLCLPDLGLHKKAGGREKQACGRPRD